jgi:hypothetical protein
MELVASSRDHNRRIMGDNPDKADKLPLPGRNVGGSFDT